MSMVRANGIEVHVEEVAPVGDRRGTVVLIHGMTSDSMASWFLTLAHPLAEAGMRVLLYDLRGHGRSVRPATGYRLDDFVDDLAALLAHWDVDEPVHLFGNSFGGTVAFTYAARHPDRVAGILTIESAPPTATWFARMARRLATAAETLADADAVVNSRPLTARRFRDASALLAETDLREQLPASALPDPATFSAITCPVLCLYGGESAVQELAGETARLVPQSRHVVVPGQKHTLLIKAPAQVRAEVLPWLTTRVH
ncbi:alpha/beta fold hydrolase [Pseudosporangium ferrugineum]|uniref:Alpha-beta hydrolase superfamily lysophospholipase n=1 Tax=Pseudosporangium ferrugineum TaxID=439699 RepID=A0A2T0S4S0_9ACTN|nr:alpha/beta hydrolase [Pseudosporangium ferrugineum]PRY28410.1 alpha-beta hydrolase superfamily lysophospholipase [Pseudosporangium ferrugineum]